MLERKYNPEWSQSPPRKQNFGEGRTRKGTPGGREEPGR